MFFQSFYAQYALSGTNTVSVNLFVNENALAATYLGSASYAQGVDPFTITPFAIKATLSEIESMPIFSVSMKGISAKATPTSLASSTTTTPYFYMDFSNSEIVAWDSTC